MPSISQIRLYQAVTQTKCNTIGVFDVAYLSPHPKMSKKRVLPPFRRRTDLSLSKSRPLTPSCKTLQYHWVSLLPNAANSFMHDAANATMGYNRVQNHNNRSVSPSRSPGELFCCMSRTHFPVLGIDSKV